MKQTFNPLDKNGFIFFVDEIWKRITNKFNDLSKVAFSGKYTDLTDAPKLKTVAISGSYNDLSDKPTMVSLNNNRIATLNNFSQINKIGFWQIAAIDAVYASDIGIERNTGDFHAIVLSYNGDGTNFNFGNIILTSPRLGNDYYLVRMWEKVAYVTYHKAEVPSLTNNLLAAVPGQSALDAVQGMVLGKDLYDQMNFSYIYNPQSKNEVAEKIFEIFNSNIKLHSINFGIFKDKTGGLDIPNGKYWGKIVYNSGDVSGILLSTQSEKDRLNISGYIHGTPRSINIEYFRDDPDLQQKIDQLNSDLKKSGIMDNLLLTTRINDSFMFEDLIRKQSVTFFTNWTDKTNFPVQYGSGIVLPAEDSRNRYIIYTASSGLYYGYYYANNGVTWTKIIK